MSRGYRTSSFGVGDRERESVWHVVLAWMLERMPDHQQPPKRLDTQRATLQVDDLAVESVREPGRDGLLLRLPALGLERATNGKIEPVARKSPVKQPMVGLIAVRAQAVVARAIAVASVAIILELSDVFLG